MAARTLRYEPKARLAARDTRRKLARNNPYPVRRHVPQEPVDDDRIYVVEKILDRRMQPSKSRTNPSFDVLVKWQNYGDEWNSWEPESEIRINCSEMVNDFLSCIDRKGPDDRKLHCLCKQPYHYQDGAMMHCSNCLEWYHLKCINMDMEVANSLLKFFCKKCREQNPDLQIQVKPAKLNSMYGHQLAKRIQAL